MLRLTLFSAAMAGLATLALTPLCIGVGYGLSRYRGPAKAVLETLVSLPLVLPPTAVGLLLLELLAPSHAFGALLESMGLGVLFTPGAVVLAAMVMAFPLWTRTARSSFESLDARYLSMARTLGCSPRQAFFRVALPMCWRGLLAGGVLAFARALGEFGATMLIAGNIPGRTQTLSLAIFQRVQHGDDVGAWQLAAVSVVLSLGCLFVVEFLSKGRTERLSQ